MKKIYISAIIALISFSTYAQRASQSIDSLAHWMGDSSLRYNDIWGYVDSSGNEYAIIGSNWGTYFIDVTDPNNLVLVNEFAGAETGNHIVWRDFAAYQTYLYGVADGDFGNTLQIFDLQYLPDSVVKVYDDSTLSQSTHNIKIEGGRAYLADNDRTDTSGTQVTYALEILDVATDPINPTRLLTMDGNTYFNNQKVHDLYVKNDTAYCSASFSGLYIYDLTNLSAVKLISSVVMYPQQGYNHSNWVSADGKTVIVADEIPAGLSLKAFDISDIKNPEFESTFHSNTGATPHNPFIKDSFAIVSYYMDGVYVFNIADPANPYKVAYYDTYPDNVDYNSGPYEGCWGVYPFLPSTNIIASDRDYGLFVLGIDYSTLSSVNEELGKHHLHLYPNPATDRLTISTDIKVKQIVITDLTGKEVHIATGKTTLDISSLAPGAYVVQIQTDKSIHFRKIIKQ